MCIEFIVSTMNCTDPIKLAKKMNLNDDSFITIINQVKERNEIVYINDKFKVIYSTEVGVSNSRNLGLKNIFAEADILCFTDDDVVYEDNVCDLIYETFSNNKKIDMAVFNVKCINANRQITRIKNVHNVDNTNIFRYALYNLAIKKECIQKYSDLKFNTDFGGNSNKYLCGEDTLFIYKLYKLGCKIKAFPQEIAKVNHEESTWYDKEGTKHYFISKGALFYACDSKMYILYIVYFAIKHFRKFNASIFYVLKHMFKGAKEYKCRKGKV